MPSCPPSPPALAPEIQNTTNNHNAHSHPPLPPTILHLMRDPPTLCLDSDPHLVAIPIVRQAKTHHPSSVHGPPHLLSSSASPSIRVCRLPLLGKATRALPMGTASPIIPPPTTPPTPPHPSPNHPFPAPTRPWSAQAPPFISEHGAAFLPFPAPSPV